MFLFSEPAWRYFLFMVFICAYSLVRVVTPLYQNHRRKWQRIKKITDRVLQKRSQEGSLIHRPIKVEVPVMSLEKRCMLALELTAGAVVFVISLGWGGQLLQTAIHTHRGIVSAAERDQFRAINEYEMALKTNPVAGKLYYAFSALQTKGEPQNADLNDAKIRTRLHPDDPEAYNELGSQYMCLKRYKEAVTAFHTAVMLRPESGVMHSNLGSALSADMQIDAALNEFQRAVTTSPFFGTYHNSLAGVYFYKQDLKHAEEEYRRAIRDNPALIQPYWRLSDILARQGRREEAKSTLQDLLKQAHMPEDAVIIGQIHTTISTL